MLKRVFAHPTVRGYSALYAGTFLSGAWEMIIPTMPVLAPQFGVSMGAAAQIATAFAIGKSIARRRWFVGNRSRDCRIRFVQRHQRGAVDRRPSGDSVRPERAIFGVCAAAAGVRVLLVVVGKNLGTLSGVLL